MQIRRPGREAGSRIGSEQQRGKQGFRSSMQSRRDTSPFVSPRSSTMTATAFSRRPTVSLAGNVRRRGLCHTATSHFHFPQQTTIASGYCALKPVALNLTPFPSCPKKTFYWWSVDYIYYTYRYDYWFNYWWGEIYFTVRGGGTAGVGRKNAFAPLSARATRASATPTRSTTGGTGTG